MHTYYLFLELQLSDRPSIIRQCQAATKEAAALVFAARLNTTAKGDTFTASELLSAIKQDTELTEAERHWIATEDPELLAL
jgi:hypothetical protein